MASVLRLAEQSVVGQAGSTGSQGKGMPHYKLPSHPGSKFLDNFDVEEVLITLMNNEK